LEWSFKLRRTLQDPILSLLRCVKFDKFEAFRQIAGFLSTGGAWVGLPLKGGVISSRSPSLFRSRSKTAKCES
jgi:hypothetical protein